MSYISEAKFQVLRQKDQDGFPIYFLKKVQKGSKRTVIKDTGARRKAKG